MSEVVLQVGVKALLKNPQGKYLLVKRSQKAYPTAICGWEPVGGRITPGLPLLENLKREIKEETGITKVRSFKLVAAQDILRIEGKHVVRLTYTADVEDEEIILDSENVEFIWTSPEELKTLNEMDPYLQELVKDKKI